MTDIDRKQLAKQIIVAEKMLAELNKQREELDKRRETGKEYIADLKKQMIDILDGTGETVCFENFEITCNSPKGSVEIKGEVPARFCNVKEVLTPDKTAIKKAIEAGENIDFATIVYNTKLNIKEV